MRCWAHPCSAEAKLLISSTQTQQALAALHAGKPSSRLVYLYDTDQLELLSHGLIVRLRAGRQGDLTLKLRSNKKEACTCPSEGGEAAKCEADLVGSDVLTSYSIRKGLKDSSFLRTGGQVHSALSVEQLKVLSVEDISVDWLRVKPKVEIQSTDWAVHTIGDTVKTGKRFEPGPTYADVFASYQGSFRAVESRHYVDYVGFSLWFYESSDFPLLQCFWPDESHRFPWEDACADWVRKAQPLLYQPTGNAA